MHFVQKTTKAAARWLGIVVVLSICASRADAYYLRTDWLQQIDRFKISNQGTVDANFDFSTVNGTESITMKPDPSGFVFGIGDYFANSRADVTFGSTNRKSDTGINTAGDMWALNVKETSMAFSMYKDFVKHDIFSAYYVGSLQYVKLKPTLRSLTIPVSPTSITLKTQSNIAGYLGLGGKLNMTQGIAIDVSARVGYAAGKTKARKTPSSTGLILTKPSVLYALYAGLVWEL